jgi:pentatricopeptide repeat protein
MASTPVETHIQVGDVAGARALLAEMRGAGFSPDAVGYTAVMQAVAPRDWREAQALYDQVRVLSRRGGLHGRHAGGGATRLARGAGAV